MTHKNHSSSLVPYEWLTWLTVSVLFLRLLSCQWNSSSGSPFHAFCVTTWFPVVFCRLAFLKRSFSGLKGSDNIASPLRKNGRFLWKFISGLILGSSWTPVFDEIEICEDWLRFLMKLIAKTVERSAVKNTEKTAANVPARPTPSPVYISQFVPL